MGLSRLLAKGWAVFCLFAGLYAGARALADPLPLAMNGLAQIMTIVLLFGAMGLLFIAGFAAAFSHGPLLSRLARHRFALGFTEIVYVVFALAVFLVQVPYPPMPAVAEPLQGLAAAMGFAVPGQSSLVGALGACGLDGGRLFASSFAWLLAFILIGSSLSRMGLTAGILRLERKTSPQPLAPAGTALLLGAAAIVCIQLLYLGSIYQFVPCLVWQGVGGDMLIGQAPLMLAYLVIAALTNLFAMSEEA